MQAVSLGSTKLIPYMPPYAHYSISGKIFISVASNLRPRYYKLFVQRNYFHSLKIFLALNSDLQLHPLHQTSQRPLEQSRHRVNLCLVHGDLNSLPANDHLC